MSFKLDFRITISTSRAKPSSSLACSSSQLPTGGSTKGTTLQLGTYGLRLLSSVRLTAKQLQSAEVAVKRKIKAVKGAECWMRVFPDVPVCVKGNETRMGKGKGAFEYWACRYVPPSRAIHPKPRGSYG